MSSVARSTAAPAAVKRLFFFRHGQSVANLTGDTEVLDPSLTELGFQQAASWRSKVSSLDLDHVFVSPLRRTLQTATQIFQDTDVPMSVSRLAREHWWQERTCRGLPSKDRLACVLEMPRGEILVPSLEELDATPNRFWDPAREFELGWERKSHMADEEACSNQLLSFLNEQPMQRLGVVCHYGVISHLLQYTASNCECVEAELIDGKLTVISGTKPDAPESH